MIIHTKFEPILKSDTVRQNLAVFFVCYRGIL